MLQKNGAKGQGTTTWKRFQVLGNCNGPWNGRDRQGSLWVQPRLGLRTAELRCAYLGWGLEEASLIDLASWPAFLHVLIDSSGQ